MNQFIIFQGQLLGKFPLSFGECINLQNSLLCFKAGIRDFLAFNRTPRDHAETGTLRLFAEMSLGWFLIDGPG